MKYYKYISDTKVDMFYSQIPQGIKSKIATELKIDLKVLGTGLSTTFKDKPQDDTRYSKLQIVLDYLGNNRNIGTVDDPQIYFFGNMSMYWHKFGDAVWFGGWTDNTICLLGGGAYHLIGSNHPRGDNISINAVGRLVEIMQGTIREMEMR